MHLELAVSHVKKRAAREGTYGSIVNETRGVLIPLVVITVWAIRILGCVKLGRGDLKLDRGQGGAESGLGRNGAVMRLQCQGCIVSLLSLASCGYEIARLYCCSPEMYWESSSLPMSSPF